MNVATTLTLVFKTVNSSVSNKPIYNPRSQTGIVFIELALVFAVLLIIFAGAIDITRLVLMHQQMSVLSRDGASNLIRKCLDVDSSGASTCVNTIHADLINHMRLTTKAGSGVVLSIYECTSFQCHNPDATTCTPAADLPTCTCSCPGGVSAVQSVYSIGATVSHPTRLNPTLIHGNFPTLLNMRKRVLTAEVYGDFKPFLNLIGARLVYEASIS